MKSTELFYFSNSSPESTSACRWMAAEMENNLNIFVSSGGGKKFNFPQKDTEKVFPSHLVYWRPKNNICRLPLTLNHWHNPFVLAPSSSSWVQESFPFQFHHPVCDMPKQEIKFCDNFFLPASTISDRTRYTKWKFYRSCEKIRKESRENIRNFLFHFI